VHSRAKDDEIIESEIVDMFNRGDAETLSLKSRKILKGISRE